METPTISSPDRQLPPAFLKDPTISRDNEPIPALRQKEYTDTEITELLIDIAELADDGIFEPAKAENYTDMLINLLPAIESDTADYTIGTVHKNMVAAQVYARLAQKLPEGSVARNELYEKTRLHEQAARRDVRIDTLTPPANKTVWQAAFTSQDNGLQVLSQQIKRMTVFRELEPFSDAVRSGDFEAAAQVPFPVEIASPEAQHYQINSAHESAIEFFETAWNPDQDEDEETRVINLNAALEEGLNALLDYQPRPDENSADPIAFHACRLLVAQTIHDLADRNEFAHNEGGNSAGHEVAIEMLAASAHTLREYLETKLQQSTAPLGDIRLLSVEQLRKHQETISLFPWYKWNPILEKIDYFKNLYAHELGYDPTKKIEEAPTPEENQDSVRELGAKVAELTVAMHQERFALPATEPAVAR